MKKQIKRKIYLLSKRESRPIEVVQYETGVQLVFEVQDIVLDETATATLFVRKPSGKFVFQEDNISLTGNTVVIDLHNQAITEHGHPFFQIKFKKGEEVISTYSGMLTVETSLEDSGAEESKTVIAAFDKFTDAQIARIEEATRSQIDLMKAEVEAKGLAVLSTIPDDYTEMINRVNALYNSVANAIKGTVSGSVVRADDVSPVEHFPVVKVHGKNLFDISKITDATHIVNNGDGTLSVTSVTDSYSAATGKTLRELAPSLKAGEAYTLTALTDVTSNVRKKMYLSHSKGNRSWMFGETVMLDNIHLDSRVYFYANDNENATIISNIQIEEGETATEYTPYIDPTTVTVKMCGKNLINSTDFVNNAVVETSENTYSITKNGTDRFSNLANFYVPGGETVRLSGKIIKDTRATNNSFMVQVHHSDGSMTYPNAFIKDGVFLGVITPDVAIVGMRIYIESKETDGATITFSNLQIEYGSTPTDFEPYKETATHTPSSAGTVEGIASLSPVMTLLTDTEGITIECEYNKDTGKVIEKLTNAVVALGGVV